MTYPRDSRADEYSQPALNPGGNVDLSRAQGESKLNAEYCHYPTGRLKHGHEVRLPCFRVKASWPSLMSLTKTSRPTLLPFCLTAQFSSLVLLYFFLSSEVGNLECAQFLYENSQTFCFRLTQLETRSFCIDHNAAVCICNLWCVLFCNDVCPMVI